MPAFDYKALDKRGKQTTGVIEADSAKAVRQQLREKGMAPLAVEQAREKQSSSGSFSRRGSLSASDLALVTRQLSTLIQSGIPIEQALSAAAQQSEKPAMKSMMIAIRSKVMEGYTLADSLGSFHGHFHGCTGPPWPQGNTLATWTWCLTVWRITPKPARKHARRYSWPPSTPLS